MNFNDIDKWLEEKLPEMEKDLAELVKHNSIEAESAPDAPFGTEVEAALEDALKVAERLGFSTRNEHYYGIADMGGTAGEDGDFYAVLGHLDVVPAVPRDWEHDPFSLTAEGDRLYGRGTMDDKGPMLAALYGAAALAKAGFEPDAFVRFIFGTNEETHMAGVKKYKEREKMPIGGFTPDADWPLVIGEKGICQFNVGRQWIDAEEKAFLILNKINAGTANNIVPAMAEARFEIGEGAELQFADSEDITVVLDGEEIVITAYGTAAHGSAPEQGDNALTKLLRYIDRLDFSPAPAKAFVADLVRLTADDKTGKDMGLSGSDEYSVTTVSPNILHMDRAGGTLTNDMRYRVTDKPEKYKKLLAQLAERENVSVDYSHVTAPLFADKTAPLVSSLLSAYRDVTGDMTEPLVIGGGTYAKVIPGMVAFGCEPVDEPSRAHQADEYITRAELLSAARVYARAIYNLTK
ncbi:MAG: Sapep family Mn(2+)-dependent dipeptidase [Lachnospiraceae bacterium]|nr:Sapep family Mn(2+)-dependent dipeptidase [Lachnospiraceae bacterium]